jgi:methionine-rich copper-binding protein CopC
MVIKAGPDLVPGNYYFTVDYDVVGGEGHFMDNIVIAVHK